MTISFDKSKTLTFFQRHDAFSALIVFVCLSVYALGANPFAGQTVAPFDRLLQFPGWSTIQSDRSAVHTERSDILDSQLPTWITLKDQIRKGETPLWYPNGAGGQPISLELCNPAFLLFVAIKDNAVAYYMVGLAKLVISGFGCYLLLRIFLRWLPSMWGGIVFMLCGFNAAWFFWEQVTTAMWIPWLFWATVSYLKTEDRRWLPAIAICSLLLIFGGFPPVAAFGFYAFALLIIAWNISDFIKGGDVTPPSPPLKLRGGSGALFIKSFEILKKTALPLLAVGISFLMSAITIIPFRDFLSGTDQSRRTGFGPRFSIHDLSIFFSFENPPPVERTVYVGIAVLIFSLVGIFQAFRTADEKLRKFILLNLFLVIVTISITFGLLPEGLIRALPVFNSNPWGRLIVITLLALSVLSAVGLNFIEIKLRELSSRYFGLTPLNAHLIMTVLLIGIIAVQFHSQKSLFNRFNAVVPSAWFYPLTPSIKYVKEHLRPLQSVIADANSYWFAGTLGAYGIPEWYAHSYRTDREKEVLSELAHNRSKSPTTMVIDGKSIRFNSPLMDKLAIKYLLVNKDMGNKRLFELAELSHDPAPPLPYNVWKQYIYIPENIVAGAIGFSFVTYGEEHAPANVRLTLYRDSDKNFFLDSYLDKNEITEKEWAFFPLPDKTFLDKGGYYLVLSLPGYSGPRSLTVWATKNKDNTGSFLEINGAKTDLSLIWKIGYFEDMDLVAKNWKMITLENDNVIYENRHVTNSAYFVKDLDASGDGADFSDLDVKRISVDRIEIDNTHRDAGWIVLPMSLHPGWKAYIDDRQVKYDTYLGILPAIPVNGPSHVTFEYEPKSFHSGLKVSLAGLFVFLVFSGFCLGRLKSRSDFRAKTQRKDEQS
jgi:hypothetical protein